MGLSGDIEDVAWSTQDYKGGDWVYLSIIKLHLNQVDEAMPKASSQSFGLFPILRKTNVSMKLLEISAH